MRLKPDAILLGVTVLLSVGYSSLLVYAKQQFGATPSEVNAYLHYWVLGKGRLKPAAPPAPAATRQGRWKQDLTYLKTELPRLHANAFHHISQADWFAKIDALSARIPTLTDEQLTVGVLELVAAIGDGHTNVMWWSYEERLPRAPIKLRWFGDDLYVVAAANEATPVLGSKVLEIGGQPTLKATQMAYPLTSGDSDWNKSADAKNIILYADAQRWLGLNADEFVFEKEGRQQVKMKLKPIVPSTELRWDTPEAVPMLMDTPTDKLFWFKKLNDHTIYLRYLECDKADEFKPLAQEILAELRQMPPATRKLILDVRVNGGGNSMVIGPLQSGLNSLGFGRGGGTAAVLTNRYTYSSAFDNAATFKKMLGAKLYGEAPGENLSTYGEVKWFLLPNSKLEIHLSSRYYPTIIPELGDGLLQPDVKITQTFEQYKAGVDPVLDAALLD